MTLSSPREGRIRLYVAHSAVEAGAHARCRARGTKEHGVVVRGVCSSTATRGRPCVRPNTCARRAHPYRTGGTRSLWAPRRLLQGPDRALSNVGSASRWGRLGCGHLYHQRIEARGGIERRGAVTGVRERVSRGEARAKDDEVETRGGAMVAVDLRDLLEENICG